MKIYLTTVLDENDNEVELYYQTLKSFEEHSEEIRQFIESKFINSLEVFETLIEGMSGVPRLDKQIYRISEDLHIAVKYIYHNPVGHKKSGLHTTKIEYHGNK